MNANAKQDADPALPDGVYFGLPMAAYLAQPRISASGIWKLRQSLATFWADSWLNPQRPERLETEASVIGTAYHMARFEPDKFADAYARGLDPADFPNVPRTQSDIERELVARGLPKKRAGERVLDQAMRLADADAACVAWPLLVAQHEGQNAGKHMLDPALFDQIAEDGRRLAKSEKIAGMVRGGAAEVSIFWTDSDGVPCKARPDYLTAEHWVDFKTFANPMEHPIEEALRRAFRYRGYWIGAAHYLDAMEAIRGGLPIGSAATDAERALVEGIRERQTPLDCWYVWQEKGGIPGLYARRVALFGIPASLEAQAPDDAAAADARQHLGRPTALLQLGRAYTEAMKRQFRDAQEIYAPGEPWSPILDAVRTWDDAEWPERFLSGEWL